MSQLAREAATRIPKLPQAQSSLQEQLLVLRTAAVRLGLYDADEWLLRRITGSTTTTSGRRHERDTTATAG